DFQMSFIESLQSAAGHIGQLQSCRSYPSHILTFIIDPAHTGKSSVCVLSIAGSSAYTDQALRKLLCFADENPLFIQISSLAFPGAEHLMRKRIIHNPELDFSAFTISQGNHAVVKIVNKICSSIYRI